MTSYTFYPIPYNPFDGNDPQKTFFEGINNAGEIVGGYPIPLDFTIYNAILYNPDSSVNNGYSHLTPPGYATGINSYGTIVGDIVGELNSSGFVDSKGTVTTLSYPGAYRTYLGGNNDYGEIAGSYSYNTSTDYGFIYDMGKFITIPGPDGYNISDLELNSINNTGEVGGYFHDSTADIDRGFVYNNGVYTVINGPSGAEDVYVTGVNNNGVVAGYYTDSAGNNEGFVYQNGQYATVDEPGATDTYVSGITAR